MCCWRTAGRKAVPPLSHGITHMRAGSRVLNQGSAKRFLVVSSESTQETKVFLGNVTRATCVNGGVKNRLRLTRRGQTHSWPQKDWGQCFHGRTKTERRAAHCISRWHPAHIEGRVSNTELKLYDIVNHYFRSYLYTYTS